MIGRCPLCDSAYARLSIDARVKPVAVVCPVRRKSNRTRSNLKIENCPVHYMYIRVYIIWPVAEAAQFIHGWSRCARIKEDRRAVVLGPPGTVYFGEPRISKTFDYINIFFFLPLFYFFFCPFDKFKLVETLGKYRIIIFLKNQILHILLSRKQFVV